MTTPSSLSAFRPLIQSFGRKMGTSAVGAGSRSFGTKMPMRRLGIVPSRSRFFTSSARQEQRQRPNLRSVLANPKQRYGNSIGRYNGGRRYQQQQQLPPYIYLVGGIPLVGSLYLYFKFQDLAPLTERRRWLATSPEYEKKMGDQNYQQLLMQYKNRILPNDHPATRTVKRIGNRIFLVAGKFAEQNGLDTSFDTRHATFTVIDSEEPNAFVLPGNHVFFMTGMLKYAKTEDEIGCILGHEMAHNLARHQGEKISSNIVVSLIGYLSLLVDPSGSFLTIFMPATKLLSDLPNSRHMESEADQIGMHLAAAACYDPAALSRVFHRMDTAGKKGKDKKLAAKPPEFLSTHPSDGHRIRDMDKWLQEDKRILTMYNRDRCRAMQNELQGFANSSAFQSSGAINFASDKLPCQS